MTQPSRLPFQIVFQAIRINEQTIEMLMLF